MQKLFRLIFRLVIVVTTSFLCICCFSAEVKNIYIESDGNNKFEAKIKAHKYGMRQVMKLMANKMGLDKSGSISVPYDALSKVFRAEEISDEYNDESFYRANVTYSYDNQDLNELILKHAAQDIIDSFYEYIIIPILKRQNHFFVQRPNQVLLSSWRDHIDELKEYRIVYPSNLNDFQTLVSSKKLSNVTYRDIVDLSEIKIFKNVMLVVMEEFAATTSGQSYVKVDYRILGLLGSHDEKSNIVYLEDGNHKASLADVVNTVASKIIEDYGNFKVHVSNLKLDSNSGIEKRPEPRKVDLYSEIYSKEEMNSIRNKLKKCNLNFEITRLAESEQAYKITISTYLGDEELTEVLYNNDLTYKKRKEKDGLILFEIKKGV